MPRVPLYEVTGKVPLTAQYVRRTSIVRQMKFGTFNQSMKPPSERTLPDLNDPVQRYGTEVGMRLAADEFMDALIKATSAAEPSRRRWRSPKQTPPEAALAALDALTEQIKQWRAKPAKVPSPVDERVGPLKAAADEAFAAGLDIAADNFLQIVELYRFGVADGRHAKSTQSISDQVRSHLVNLAHPPQLSVRNRPTEINYLRTHGRLSEGLLDAWEKKNAEARTRVDDVVEEIDLLLQADELAPAYIEQAKVTFDSLRPGERQKLTSELGLTSFDTNEPLPIEIDAMVKMLGYWERTGLDVHAFDEIHVRAARQALSAPGQPGLDKDSEKATLETAVEVLGADWGHHSGIAAILRQIPRTPTAAQDHLN